MIEANNSPQIPTPDPEVWSTTSYHGAPINEAEFVPKESREGRLYVTDIVDAQGEPQRAIVNGKATIDNEEFVRVTPLTANLKPIVVKKSELISRRSETRAARQRQDELAALALNAVHIERPEPVVLDPYSSPMEYAVPRAQIVRAQQPRPYKR